MDGTIKIKGQGTINAIAKVWVEATSTKFAMVIPDDGFRSRLAIRVGPNTTAEGDDYFLVGDRVTYTVQVGPAGAFPRAQDLVKLADGFRIDG